jgi:type IV/VI secretion system ImpK/VasF family protein
MNGAAGAVETLPGSEEAGSGANALLDLYEPLFQKVCELRRLGPRGLESFVTARARIKDLLAEIKASASKAAHLAEQTSKLERAVVFFVDGRLITSEVPFVQQWRTNLLAVHLYGNQAGGNVEFFRMLAKDLEDQSSAATERLAVYWVCLGLGFRGPYKNDLKAFEALLDKLQSRIERLGIMETDLKARICKDAYFCDTRNVQGEREKFRMILWGLVFVGFLVCIYLVNREVFKSAARDLVGSVDEIQTRTHER